MKIIESKDIKKMLLGGVQYLEIHREYVDSLNVFPIPDGDTGSNMTSTMLNGYKQTMEEINDKFTPYEIMQNFAKNTLYGSRGNSGVILSQIIKGLADGLKNSKSGVTVKVLAKAFQKASDTAYMATKKPKEGTILTVIRYIGEQAKALSLKTNNVLTFLKNCIAKGNAMLNKTPDLLPVLKKAGVVDSGGQGLMYVLEGFYRALAGIEIKDEKMESATINGQKPNIEDFHINSDAIINSDTEIVNGYCTEFFVINLKETATEEDINKLRDKLSNVGDSIVCVGNLEFVKIHVHTNQPNKALKFALDLGELDKIKIENMRQQNKAIKDREAKVEKEEEKEIAMVAVASSNKIGEMFKELSVNKIIEGGQTMNPSVETLKKAVDETNAKNVIILPNNKNIILAAERINKLTDKNIKIINTTNTIQGIRAALLFDESSSLKDNVEVMEDAIKDVNFAQVTEAVRTIEIDDLKIEKGDYIGLDDSNILVSTKKLEDTVMKLIEKQLKDSEYSIALYAGLDTTEKQNKKIVSMLQDKYEDREVTIIRTEQPHYHYMISME